jgi:hypothetical protein
MRRMPKNAQDTAAGRLTFAGCKMRVLKPSFVSHDGEDITSLDLDPTGTRLATAGDGNEACSLTQSNSVSPSNLSRSVSALRRSMRTHLERCCDHGSGHRKGSDRCEAGHKAFPLWRSPLRSVVKRRVRPWEELAERRTTVGECQKSSRGEGEGCGLSL